MKIVVADSYLMIEIYCRCVHLNTIVAQQMFLNLDQRHSNVSVNSKPDHPPGRSRGIRTFSLPGGSGSSLRNFL